MSYVRKAMFDSYDHIQLVEARMTTADAIMLCDIAERTGHRWLSDGAPRWAIRLVQSQIATLDRFDWKHWKIHGGNLYNNELHTGITGHRHVWCYRCTTASTHISQAGRH